MEGGRERGGKDAVEVLFGSHRALMYIAVRCCRCSPEGGLNAF